eukprot:2772073-Karenia_brevis.AAC.1
MLVVLFPDLLPSGLMFFSQGEKRWYIIVRTHVIETPVLMAPLTSDEAVMQFSRQPGMKFVWHLPNPGHWLLL